MTAFQSSCLVIFGILSYLIITDKNVAEYLTLVFKITKLNAERMLWMIKFHPRNPITNLMMRWKYDRLARELEKEFSDKLSNSD
jgi:hypothetical protein